jgi:hypothetical protein
MAPHTRFVSLLAALLLAATACTGDGGAAADPEAALRAALRGLAEGPGLTVTISLDTDLASLRAASADGAETVSDDALQLLADAALRVSVPLGEEPVKTGAVVFAVAGDDLVELRAFEEDVYVRADVRSLLTAAGQDPAMADGFAAMLSGAGLPTDALDGRWLKLAGATALAEQLAGRPSETADASVEAMRARMERLATILADASTVEHVGEDANGEHLRASVPLREAYDAVLANAGDLGLPQGLAGELPSREDVPEISILIDAWVRDGSLTAAAFDLRQLGKLTPDDPMPPGVERLGVHLAFAEFDGQVEIPADAVELNAQQLLGGLLGGLGAMMPGMPPMVPGMAPGMASPGAMPGPDAEVSAADGMVIDPVLVAFYGLPAYAGARLRYCRQISDMPTAVRARHYADICPGLSA